MTTNDDFLLALHENPNDETLRLVYADWLDENDDIRGTFLRVESYLYNMSEGSPEVPSLKAELSAISDRIDVRWRAAVCRVHFESGKETAHPGRIALNAEGLFYTCGTCLACEAPELEAPDLLAPLTNGNLTTYFIRQPQTNDEIRRACSALKVCCVSDLRYGGTDPLIIQLLGNSPEFCDFLLRDDSQVLVSSQATSRSE